MYNKEKIFPLFVLVLISVICVFIWFTIWWAKANDTESQEILDNIKETRNQREAITLVNNITSNLKISKRKETECLKEKMFNEEKDCSEFVNIEENLFISDLEKITKKYNFF